MYCVAMGHFCARRDLTGEAVSEVYECTRKTKTIPEAARELGISRNSAYEAAARGDLPTVRIGRRILVPAAALERMLDGGERRAG